MKSVCAALLLLAAGIASLSLVDYGSLKGSLDSLAPDNNAEQFTEDFYASFVTLLRGYALAFIALSTGLFLNRDRLRNYSPRSTTSRLIEEFRNFHRNTTCPHKLVFITIVGVGFVVRLLCIDQPMRSDESWTYLNYVSRNVFHILADYHSPNNHVLHSLLAHAAITLFGDSPIVLRLPALIAGVVSMPVAYWYVFRLSNRDAALIAMALIACWPMLIDYSVNARGYSIVVLFTLIILLAADTIRENGRLSGFLAFGLTSILGLYAVPSFALSILTAGLWVLLLASRNQVALPLHILLNRLTFTALGSFAITTCLYLPILVGTGINELFRNDVVTGVGFDFGGIRAGVFSIWDDWHQGIPLFFQLTLGGGFLSFLVMREWRYQSLWFALAASATLVCVVQRTLGPERIWIFVLPLFLGCAAIGLTNLLQIKQRAGVANLTAAIIPIMLFGQFAAKGTYNLYQEFGSFPAAREIVEYLNNEIGPNDNLFTSFPANRPIAYYDRQLNQKPRIVQHLARVCPPLSQRSFVVTPHQNSVDQTLRWHDQIRGTTCADRLYKVLYTKNFENASVVTIEFQSPSSKPKI